MLAFLRRVAPDCRHVLSVCTGSFVLHAAGLLAGRRATTHYGSLDRLRALGDIDVVEERFVKDGNVWTAAGVSAGLDMTLALIAEVAGEATAGKVQLETEYVPSAALYGGIERDPRAPRYVRGN
jgi:transcriptional regulator GlxA family with amidase domain